MDKEIASFLVQKFYEKEFKKYEKDLAKATGGKAIIIILSNANAFLTGVTKSLSPLTR
jgi:hypothetical protein